MLVLFHIRPITSWYQNGLPISEPNQLHPTGATIAVSDNQSAVVKAATMTYEASSVITESIRIYLKFMQLLSGCGDLWEQDKPYFEPYPQPH